MAVFLEKIISCTCKLHARHARGEKSSSAPSFDDLFSQLHQAGSDVFSQRLYQKRPLHWKLLQLHQGTMTGHYMVYCVPCQVSMHHTAATRQWIGF